METPQIMKRVFLNDHYSPAAGKLNGMCRKLLKENVIKKFKVLDADKPKAKLIMADGKEVTVDAVGCAGLLKDKVPV